jgi:ribosomal protein S18 acetylase RimI-like enzyme
MGVLIPSTSQRELAAQVAALLNAHNQLYYKVTTNQVLNGKVDYLLVLVGDMVVGCVGLRLIKRSDSIEICHLCVHEIARKQGMAGRLIQGAIEMSPKNRIWCHIREENIPSIKAFTSKGFQLQREKFKHDGSWMRRLRLERNHGKSSTAGQ